MCGTGSTVMANLETQALRDDLVRAATRKKTLTLCAVCTWYQVPGMIKHETRFGDRLRTHHLLIVTAITGDRS